MATSTHTIGERAPFTQLRKAFTPITLIARYGTRGLTAVGRWITGTQRLRWMSVRFVLMLLIAYSALMIGIIGTTTSFDALGQEFHISAMTPNSSVSGHGQITINSGHPATYNLLTSHYYGPLRAHLTVNAPFLGSNDLNQAITQHKLPTSTSNEFRSGFVDWLMHFWLNAFLAALCLSLALGFLNIGWSVWRYGVHKFKQALGLATRSTAMSLAVVIGASGFFIVGSSTISQASSLDQLVGHSTIHLAPPPIKGVVTGYDGVSIGDSRAATQGDKGIVNPTKEEGDCQRSSDSLAAQIGRIEQWKILNLACSAATIPSGLMGVQVRGNDTLPAQMSVVMQMKSIRVIIVTIGPNDMRWAMSLGLCYFMTVCNDNVTDQNYESLVQQFKWNYQDLLAMLYGLHNGPNGTRPEVIINGSYDAMSDTAVCSDTKGLTKQKIDLLLSRNDELNYILRQGADQFKFHFVKPRLKKFCDDLTDGPGRDIRGPNDPNAFHPTSTGVFMMAVQDVMALSSDS